MSAPQPTTAIIPVSGFNTRRLPAAALFPKEFMPIGNRPAIDFVIDDLVRAGITDIYLVVTPFQLPIFEHYFQRYDELDRHLTHTHKTAALEQIQALRQRANFHFVDDETKTSDLYGSTIPLRIALEAIGPLPSFIYAIADDFTVRRDGGSDLVDLVAGFKRSGGDGALLGITTSLDELKQRGVFETETKGETHWLRNLVEKPAHPETLPEPRLGNISKYLFTDAVRPLVMNNQPNPATGEAMITDVLAEFTRDHQVSVIEATGDYYDVGRVDTWLAANRALGGQHD
jgi:UTP--glucose-1-phosphate uridylyltransferase